MANQSAKLFSTQLPFQISPRLITAGRFDGRQVNLIFVTPNSKLPEGANHLLLLYAPGDMNDQTLVLAGGNCSVVGLNANGIETFWTVTGDVVTSMTKIASEFFEDDAGGEDLVIGSDDFTIRIFHKDSILYEIRETDAICNLVSLDKSYFGYGLRNGTIGVYNKSVRVWRIKSKHKPVTLAAYDINQDGCPELICGWDNGKVDARLRATGVIVFKTQLKSCIAGLLVTDYSGFSNILLTCSVEGEIHGYGSFDSGKKVDSAATEELLHRLNLNKQQLLLEIRGMNEGNRQEPLTGRELRQVELTQLPANTMLMAYIEHNLDEQCVQLTVRTSNDIPLRCVVLFAEGIFPGESYVIAPAAHIYPVLTATVLLPPFVDYRLVLHPTSVDEQQRLRSSPHPKSRVQFNIADRVQRMMAWIRESFLIDKEQLHLSKTGMLSVTFQPVLRKMDKRNSSSGQQDVVRNEMQDHDTPNSLLIISMNTKGEVILRTDDLDLAVDLVQSMAKYFGVADLMSTCDFPLALEQLQQLIELTEAHQTTRQQIMTDMAEKIDNIKTVLVNAEDNRMMGYWSKAKEFYADLFYSNRELLTGYHARTNEYETLTQCQKQINRFIEQASSLRVGLPKAQVITLCRKALQNKNCGQLCRAVRQGVA